MGKITIKNILNNYIPPTYLRKGMSGRPLSWIYNVYLLMADIPITLFWIICAFFSHSSYKEAFVVCAWIWGLNALVSSAIVASVFLSHNEELVNKWTSPITFLMLIFCSINVNLSLSLIDERYEVIGMQIMVNATLVLLFWTGVNIVVHFIIAIISIYKGKNVGERISNTYIIFLIGLVIFLSWRDDPTNGSGNLVLATAIFISYILFALLFNIRSVYLNFHPEKCPQNKDTLLKSKKYLK